MNRTQAEAQAKIKNANNPNPNTVFIAEMVIDKTWTINEYRRRK